MVIYRRISPNPWKNRSDMPVYLNASALLNSVIIPIPNVVAVSKTKPAMIAFLLPNVFLMIALNGAKTI